MMLSAALAAAPAFATRAHHPASAGHSAHTSATHTASHSAHSSATRSSHKAKAKRIRGQMAIEPERVTEIQQALIREHYLSGDANGKWDSTTEAAMQKFQADQGWQTKLMPDSRALKKLGLGPDYSTAINAKNASFVDPPPTSTIPSALAAGFAAGAGVNR
jgi:peptidoglycan hydrolase-like protein with peptidoglycan-binding domain